MRHLQLCNFHPFAFCLWILSVVVIIPRRQNLSLGTFFYPDGKDVEKWHVEASPYTHCADIKLIGFSHLQVWHRESKVGVIPSSRYLNSYATSLVSQLMTYWVISICRTLSLTLYVR